MGLQAYVWPQVDHIVDGPEGCLTATVVVYAESVAHAKLQLLGSDFIGRASNVFTQYPEYTMTAPGSVRVPTMRVSPHKPAPPAPVAPIARVEKLSDFVGQTIRGVERLNPRAFTLGFGGGSVVRLVAHADRFELARIDARERTVIETFEVPISVD